MIKVSFRPVGLDASKNVTMGAQSSASFSLRLCSCNPELHAGLAGIALACSLLQLGSRLSVGPGSAGCSLLYREPMAVPLLS